MYHQPSKRKLLIQRTAVYSLMTVSIIGLVTVLIFVILGYRFNGNDGKIEQGGLVQFDSRPTGADVTIDGGKFGTRTTSKTTMSAGQHFITMARDGYATWQKSINVVPGSILWLNYARLIPNKLAPSSVADFSTVAGSLATSDKKWMAVKDVASTPVIKLADLSRDEVKVTDITIPAAIFTAPSEGKTQTFTLAAWDPSSRYILVKHLYDDQKTEWLVADTQNIGDTKNITRLLDVDISKLTFSNNNSSILYAQIGHDVRKIDVGNATLSRPLVTNVADFALYGDAMVTYTTLVDPATKARSVGYYVDGMSAPRVVRSYTDDGATPLQFTVGRYFNDTFETIAYGNTIEILKGDLPRDDTSKLALRSVVSVPLAGGAQFLTTKTNGRFIVAQNSPTVVTYDVELFKASTINLKGSSAVAQVTQWLDDYTLWSDRDDMLRFYEFDGENQHDIMPITSGFTVTLSPSGKYVYGISKSNDGNYHLSRVQLINS